MDHLIIFWAVVLPIRHVFLLKNNVSKEPSTSSVLFALHWPLWAYVIFLFCQLPPWVPLFCPSFIYWLICVSVSVEGLYAKERENSLGVTKVNENFQMRSRVYVLHTWTYTDKWTCSLQTSHAIVVWLDFDNAATVHENVTGSPCRTVENWQNTKPAIMKNKNHHIKKKKEYRGNLGEFFFLWHCFKSQFTWHTGNQYHYCGLWRQTDLGLHSSSYT